MCVTPLLTGIHSTDRLQNKHTPQVRAGVKLNHMNRNTEEYNFQNKSLVERRSSGVGPDSKISGFSLFPGHIRHFIAEETQQWKKLLKIFVTFSISCHAKHPTCDYKTLLSTKHRQINKKYITKYEKYNIQHLLTHTQNKKKTLVID